MLGEEREALSDTKANQLPRGRRDRCMCGKKVPSWGVCGPPPILQALARQGFALHLRLLRHTHQLHTHFSTPKGPAADSSRCGSVVTSPQSCSGAAGPREPLQLVLCPITVPSTLIFVPSGQLVAYSCFLMVVKRISARESNSQSHTQECVLG